MRVQAVHTPDGLHFPMICKVLWVAAVCAQGLAPWAVGYLWNIHVALSLMDMCWEVECHPLGAPHC